MDNFNPGDFGPALANQDHLVAKIMEIVEWINAHEERELGHNIRSVNTGIPSETGE